jgi:hypothetical protein
LPCIDPVRALSSATKENKSMYAVYTAGHAFGMLI